MIGDVPSTGELSAHEVVQRLYAEHGAALRGYVNRLLRDPHLAEDVVQDTMVRAWQHADRLAPNRGPAWGWLVTVARNIAVDRIRARQLRPLATVEDVSALPGMPNVADHASGVASSLAMEKALDKLSVEYRSTLVEVYFGGKTARGAAAALNVPIGTVKSRLHQGLRLLRRHVEHEELRLSA